MIGNCLTYAISDFFKNGGSLYIVFIKGHRAPHFEVQRGKFVYDLEIIRMILQEFWYDGDPRVTKLRVILHLKHKRFKLATRRVRTS